MKSRFRRVQKKDSNVDLDITSLLDILVILLVFLLKSFNASDLTLDLVSNLQLPLSQSKELGNRAVIIQINKNLELFLDHEMLVKVDQLKESETIAPLLERLKVLKLEQDSEQKNKIANVKSINEDKNKTEGYKINIVLDQSLPYELMKKVMHTAATAGFPQFKFIVQGREQ